MKKLILATAFLVSCSPAIAEEPLIVSPPEVYWAQKPVQCGNLEKVIELVKEYGEEPLLSGKGLAMGADGVGENITIVLGANRQTQTWTLVEIQANGVTACILGSGSGYQVHESSAIPTRG